MFILCYYCLWVWLVLMSLLARRGNVSFYCKKERKMKKDKGWTSKTSPSDTITCTHTFHLSIVDPASISAWTPSAQKITTKTIITCHIKRNMSSTPKLHSKNLSLSLKTNYKRKEIKCMQCIINLVHGHIYQVVMNLLSTSSLSELIKIDMTHSSCYETADSLMIKFLTC